MPTALLRDIMVAMADGQGKPSPARQTREAIVSFLGTNDLVDKIVSTDIGRHRLCTPELIQNILWFMVEKDMCADDAAMMAGVPRDQWQKWYLRAKMTKGRQGVYAMLRDTIYKAELAQKARMMYVLYQKTLGGSVNEVRQYLSDRHGGPAPIPEEVGGKSISLTVNMIGFVQEMRTNSDLDHTVETYPDMVELWNQDQKALPQKNNGK